MYTEKRLSLVERKKLQWAKEREELAELNAPWGRDLARLRNATNLQTSADILRRNSVPRRQSLPPLYKTQNGQNSAYASSEKLEEMGGETSGYGSDNVNNTPEKYTLNTWETTVGGYESSSSAREDRLKWGDRGVHVAKFWEPKETDSGNKTGDTPGWVKRGLEGNTELVVSNTSPAESPEQDYLDRPETSSTTSQNRCYLRGQNVQIDPVELAERERRRQLALAHQEAIRQQLEERERKKREERERKQREEYEEEQRIKKEKEIERIRKETEDKLLLEKLEREKKRKEALQEAIEIAEKQALQEKQKLKMLKLKNVNINENVIEKDNQKSPRRFISINNKENNVNETNQNCVQTNQKCTQPNQNTQPNQMIEATMNLTETEIVSNNNNNDNLIVTNNPEQKTFLKNKNETQPGPTEDNIITETIKNNNNNKVSIPPLQLAQNNQENLALVLQTPFETFQNMQFAVFMPTSGPASGTTLPIAVPIAISDRSSNTARTENRLLTPTQYRNKRFCDSSTQTELSELNKTQELRENNILRENNFLREKYLREKMSNMDLSYENQRKDRRMRQEERARESMEERPKWGVNRPPTRYMKQSEKDLVYQKKKLRQKQRQGKKYDEKSHSSDDSPTGSPRTYRKVYQSDKRRGRALWRKSDQLFGQNIRVYQTEIVPLESDKDQIYYKDKSCRHCCCRCRDITEKYNDHFKVVDILKIEHNSPRECAEYKEAFKSQLLPDMINNNSMDSCSEIYDKSNSIQNDFSKADAWDN